MTSATRCGTPMKAARSTCRTRPASTWSTCGPASAARSASSTRTPTCPSPRPSTPALTSGGKKLTAVLGKPTYTGTHNLLIAAGSQLHQRGGRQRSRQPGGQHHRRQVDGGAGDDRCSGPAATWRPRAAGHRHAAAEEGGRRPLDRGSRRQRGDLTRTNKAPRQRDHAVATVTDQRDRVGALLERNGLEGHRRHAVLAPRRHGRPRRPRAGA
jgi:hypothetical protein